MFEHQKFITKSLFSSSKVVNQVEYCLVWDLDEENIKNIEEIVEKQKRFLLVAFRHYDRSLPSFP